MGETETPNNSAGKPESRIPTILRWGTKTKTFDLTIEELIQLRRSKVRILVTRFAAYFLFLGGALFIAVLLAIAVINKSDKFDAFGAAKDIFLAILPISTGIVGFWFAGRSAKKNQD